MAKQKSRFPSYGLVRGPSHERGGVAGMVAGEQPVELEGGEWIIPKEAVPDYLPVLKQITNEGRAMQQMQNGNSAMDALIASATMEAGISEPKTPMFQEGGSVSDNTRVAMNEFMPDISYDFPTFDGKTKERQYSMSNMPMSDEEMMDIAMGMATPGSAIGSLGRKALKGAKGLPKLSKRAREYIKESLGDASNVVSRNESQAPGLIDFSKTFKNPEFGAGSIKKEQALREYGRRQRLSREIDSFEPKYADTISDALSPSNYKEADSFMENALESGLDLSDALAARKLKFGYEQGGMIDEYEGGGQLHSRRMYNQEDKKKYGYQMGGKIDEYQDGGQVSSNMLPELLSNINLQMRKPKGFLPPEETLGYATSAYTSPSRPKDYYDYLENLEDTAAEGEKVEATDENMIKYYLSKFKGSPPTGYSRNSVTGDVESNYVNRMRMFEDRSKKEGRYVMGDPRNEELRDAFTVKKYLDEGNSFDKLAPTIKNKVLKRARGLEEEESDRLINFFKRYDEDARTNPFSPNYRPQKVSESNYQKGGMINQYQQGGKAEELVKFRSPLLNKQKYTMTDLMALEAGMPEDEMLVGYDDIRDMDSPRVKALQELAGVLSTRIQSETQKTPEYGLEYHLRGKPARSVLGDYSSYGNRLQRTINGIPMIDPVEVRPEYQRGGQIQPRKQQEIRNPQMYGPPINLMGPDTTGEGFQQMLNQMRMRDVNQSINPLTGDSLDIEGDSLKLLQRMKKSKIPRARRKIMQQGGKINYDVIGLESLENRFPNFDAPMSNPEFEAAMQYGERGMDSPQGSPEGSFMSSLGKDKRVRPSDSYTIQNGFMSKREIPKLSSAYMQSMGIETPLSRRQRSLLQRKAIAPETLNPQVQSLLGRALIQRLANEPL